jgi:hypothetical protein
MIVLFFGSAIYLHKFQVSLQDGDKFQYLYAWDIAYSYLGGIVHLIALLSDYSSVFKFYLMWKVEILCCVCGMSTLYLFDVLFYVADKDIASTDILDLALHVLFGVVLPCASFLHLFQQQRMPVHLKTLAIIGSQAILKKLPRHS